eukprot:COSAG06_NODE_2901_length_6117_cov_8.965936_1_plen_87_part_10
MDGASMPLGGAPEPTPAVDDEESAEIDDDMAVARAQVHYAVERDDLPLLREVCGHVAPSFDLSDANGWAVLHWCARYGRPALALAAL